MSIYGDIILDHYHNPRNNKKLTNPTATVHVDNPLCGDSLDMELIVDKGTVKEVGFSGEGCAISIASASLLSEHIKGKTIKDILPIDPDFVLRLVNIELSPNRLKCALLPWEGIMKLVKKSF
jgi:nitrogen fixation NifU-like protein